MPVFWNPRPTAHFEEKKNPWGMMAQALRGWVRAVGRRGSASAEEGASERYLLRLAYDGTKYDGWQRQLGGGGRGVQEAVEDMLREGFGCAPPVRVVGASRTDAGVHALGNAAVVEVRRVQRRGGDASAGRPPLGTAVMLRALNAHLLARGEAVRVTEVRRAAPALVPTRDAVSREYVYRLLFGTRGRAAPLPFQEDRAWHVELPLADLDGMRRAAAALVGAHDFSAFRGAGCQAATPVRELFAFDVCVAPLGFELPAPPFSDVVRVDMCVRGRSFLYHQVRNMVGVLKEVGVGRLHPDAVARALELRDPEPWSRMRAPPYGLYLREVVFPEELLLPPLPEDRDTPRNPPQPVRNLHTARRLPRARPLTR